MSVGKYILRAIKYFVKLVVLLAIILLLMLYSNTSTLSTDNFFADFFSRTQTWILLVAVVVWSAVYPRVEFVKRIVEGNLHADKIGIINALRAGGMRLDEESNGRMVFVDEAPLRRLLWLGEDRLTLTQLTGGMIEIEGARRFAGDAQQRIPGYVEREKDNN
jgi:uncharacterized integral membrane protein